MKRSHSLGELQLAIMRILWQQGEATVAEVHSRLLEERGLAPTTVATMLKVMLEKGLVERVRGERHYRWSARVSQDNATSGLLRQLIDAAFDGSAKRMVAHLMEHGKIGDKERREIIDLVGAHRKDDQRRRR